MSCKNIEIIKYDVLKAIEYSLDAEGVNALKVKKYQLDRACDARYTFKIIDLLKQCEIVYIEYRGKKFIYKNKELYQI